MPSPRRQTHTEARRRKAVVTANQSLLFGPIILQETTFEVPSDFNGQVVLEFDWSDAEIASTGDVANALASFLYTTYVDH